MIAVNLTPTKTVSEQIYQVFILLILELSGKRLVTCIVDTRGQCVLTDQL